MKCGTGFPSFRLFRATPALSAVLVSLCLLGCEYMNKDMLGYLRHWTETVQVGRVEVSNAAVQKDDSGADTIPVAAAPIITSYIINPQGYGLDATVGTEGSSSSTVRVSSAVLPQATVTSSDSTMMAVQLAAAADSMEHTSFTVGFVPVRTDTMQSAPEGMAVTLRYNTPSLPPARVNRVVAEDGSVSYVLVREGELWKAGADGNLYWAWDDTTTDETSPRYAKWFEVGGVRRLLAECRVHPETKVGTRSLFRWNTGNAGTTLAAVDGEGVSSAAVTSGTVVPAGSDVTPPGSVTGVAATYAADGTVTVTWTDPVDTDGDLQEIEVTLSGNASAPVVKGVPLKDEVVSFDGIPGDGRQYTITVVAVDASGNRSTAVTVQVLADGSAPASVTDLTASYNNRTITVNWKDPVDKDLEKIEVSLNGKSTMTSQFVQKGTQSATFTSIPDDRTEYTITVVALDASGNRSASVTEKVVADKTGPGVVTNVQSSSGETTVTLTWTNPSANDFSHVAVTSNPSLTTGSITVHSQTAGSQGSATITGLTSGTEYTFTFTSYDDLGNGDSDSTTTAKFTWQKLTLNSIIGSGFTKDNVEVAGVSGNTLVLYWTKDSTVQQTVYNAYKPKADGNTFDWWKDTTAGNQQTDPITMDRDVTLIANYSAVSADNAAAYVGGLQGAGPHNVKITGAIQNPSSAPNVITMIRDVNGVKNGSVQIILDLSSTGLTNLIDSAFYGAKGLVGISLPTSLTSIGSSAFRSTGLASIEIPNGVTIIPQAIFYECTKLTSVTIPNTVTKIDFNSFVDCTSLESVIIPASVTHISDNVFLRANKLNSVTFNNSHGWFYVSDYNDWTNKQNGQTYTASNPSTNASNLTKANSEGGYKEYKLYRQ